MIRQTAQEVLPVTCLPEPEAFGIKVVIAHGGISVWCAMEIQIHELLQVRPNDLIGVDEENFLEVHGEKDVEEQDFVRPDDALFLRLCAKP